MLSFRAAGTADSVRAQHEVGCRDRACRKMFGKIVGTVFRKAAHDSIESCRCGLAGHAELEARHHRVNRRRGIAGFWIGSASERHPDLRQRAIGLEPRRHNADKRPRIVINQKALANNRRVGMKLALPRLVVHDEYWRSCGGTVLRRDAAPHQGRHAVKVEGVRRDACGVDLMNVTSVAQERRYRVGIRTTSSKTSLSLRMASTSATRPPSGARFSSGKTPLPPHSARRKQPGGSR